MTPRQRYRETLLFGNPDKIPFEPGRPRETTLARWHEEGLPEGVNYYDHILGLLGIEKEETQAQVDLRVSFQMMPKFEEKVLEHKDGHYVVQDWMGAITEISDEYDYTYLREAKDFVTRRWLRFPVTNHDEWEQMKTRFDPRTRGRFPQDFEQRCTRMRDRDYVYGISFNGPFWQVREWVGFETLCVLMIDEPEWIHEMMDFWTEFVSRTLVLILQNVELDFVFISEDMAYKGHSMISPQMCREFLMPSWTRWSKQAQANGCPLVLMDSDGYVGELIPLWIEAGVNVESPNEVAAGCDVVKFREQYGNQMGYLGGIDKRALAKGGEVMREEVMLRCSILNQGGYIPGCDHGVPSDISWPDYLDYCRLLAKLTGWL